MSSTATCSSDCTCTSSGRTLTLLQSSTKHQAAMQRGYIDGLVSDIPDERMAAQFPGVVNHPAWHLGHLAVSADEILGAIGGKSTLDAETRARYGMGSKPVQDRAAYPSKAALVAMFDDRRTALMDAFLAMTPDQLVAANPIPSLAGPLPTVADLVSFLLVAHESMHAGQLAVWRRAAGMISAMERRAS